MKFNTQHLPESHIFTDLCGFRLSEFTDEQHDGESGTYDESIFNDYREQVIYMANSMCGGMFTTETDEFGVYLTPLD